MSFSRFLLILRARYKVILVTLLLTVASTIAVSLVLPSRYMATASVVVNFKGADPVTGLTLPAQLLPGYMVTQVDIIQSHSVARKVVDQLKLASDPLYQQSFKEDAEGKGDIRDWIADLLLAKLKIDPSRESSMIDIGFTAANPKFAADVANAFAVAYQQTNLQLKVGPSQEASSYLTDQTQVLRDKIRVAQQNLSKYQEEKGFSSNDERMDVENARLNDLSTQLVTAQSQRFEASSRQRSAANNPGDSPDVISNPLIQTLKSQLSQDESKLAQLSEKLDKNHPEYQAALAQVEKSRANLNNEIKAVSSSLSGSATILGQRESELSGALAAQKAKVLQLNRQRDEYTILQKEVDDAQHAFDAASERLTQTTLEGHDNQSEIALLNPAVPPIEASSPKLLLNILLSVVVGAILGLGFGLLLEFADRRVRSRNDIVEALDLPILGMLTKQRVRRRKSFFAPKRINRPAFST
ncbi:MAG TPA: chain length determinant protein EpsF [Methylophilaceae bacterium]|jgi:chain length determinant protein EpsF